MEILCLLKAVQPVLNTDVIQNNSSPPLPWPSSPLLSSASTNFALKAQLSKVYQSYIRSGLYRGQNSFFFQILLATILNHVKWCQGQGSKRIFEKF